MLMSYLVLLLAAASAGPRTLASQTGAEPHPVPRPSSVIVNAPVKELLEGYLRWEHGHHGTAPRPLPHAPGTHGSGALSPRQPPPQPPPFLIRVPFIELYSSSGKPLYYGASPSKNPEFIRSLPRRIREGQWTQGGAARPTLREALQMFRELDKYDASLYGGDAYILFAVTYPGDPRRCEAQDAAVRWLEARAGRVGVRVVEVRLSK